MTSDIHIRRLWAADAPAFRDHLLRLDAVSRSERFSGGVSDEFVRHYAEHCFGSGDLVFGAFVEGELRGAGELRSKEAIWSEAPPFARHAVAEAAFSVEAPHRRRGIGAQLFERIVRAAGNHGVETIELQTQADNVAMQRLATKFSTRLHFHAHQVTGRLMATRATPLSLLSEASHDAVDFAASVVDAQMRALFPRRAPGT